MFGKPNRRTIWLSAITAMFAGVISTGLYAQEPDAKALLHQMSEEIASLENFIISGDAYADARLAAGQIIEHSSQVTLRVRKPGSVRITNLDSENAREIYFSDGVFTIYSKTDNFYAQTRIPEGVASAMDFAVNQMSIDAPLIDFLSSDVAGLMLENASEVQYLGTSLIRDEVFHHIALRSEETDVQIWIATEGQHLPGKIAISSKWEGGAPRFVAFLDWDTEPDFPQGSLVFVPPEGAAEVEMLLDSQQ